MSPFLQFLKRESCTYKEHSGSGNLGPGRYGWSRSGPYTPWFLKRALRFGATVNFSLTGESRRGISRQAVTRSSTDWAMPGGYCCITFKLMPVPARSSAGCMYVPHSTVSSTSTATSPSHGAKCCVPPLQAVDGDDVNTMFKFSACNLLLHHDCSTEFFDNNIF